MSEKNKPALSAEMWATLKSGVVQVVTTSSRRVYFMAAKVAGGMGHPSVAVDPDSERHALAALALYKQDFGFTREDVAFLREVAEKSRAGARHENWHVSDELESLADRIEALLPPEDPKG